MFCEVAPLESRGSVGGQLASRVDVVFSALAAALHSQYGRYFNQASPSAYIRGRDRVVPFTLALLRNLQIRGARVLNGADVFAFELSKSAQAATMQALGIDHPRTVVFNDVNALAARLGSRLVFPAMLKPEQGGSGARMHKVESLAELRTLLAEKPHLWEPDKLLLLQVREQYENRAGERASGRASL
jgi:glutathione synthase/RimK-type ligase-like ATP-grasp enzyme